MSEQTSKVFVTPHNKAFKKGDVLKICGGYYRVLKFKDDEPYVQLIPVVKNLGYGTVYRIPSAQTEFWGTDIATGETIKMYTSPYDKNVEPKAEGGADVACRNYLSALPYEMTSAIPSIGVPPNIAYEVSTRLSTAMPYQATVTSEDGIVRKYFNQYTNATSSSTIRCRCLSIQDIIDYFGTTDLNAKSIAYDLLGAKHAKNESQSSPFYNKCLIQGWLYEASAGTGYDIHDYGRGLYIRADTYHSYLTDSIECVISTGTSSTDIIPTF